MTMRPRAVIAAPNYWTSPLQVGTHQIARTLASNGWRVAYLSDPVSPFHVARWSRADIRDRWHLNRSGGMRDVEGRVTAWLPLTPVSPRAPIVNSLSRFAASWLTRSGESVRSWLRKNGFDRPDLLWVDSVIWDRLPEMIQANRTVLRIADAGAGFPRHRAEFDEMERRLALTADLVVYTADQLREHVAGLRPKAMQQMLNGVDLVRFATTRPEPADLARIHAPRAIYVGALERWFDYSLLGHLADRLPGVSFVLVGPEHQARRELAPRPNLHLLGPRRSEEVPGYLQHSQVGLIPFDVHGHPELVHAIQPLKLYEYLATGLPVVAARWTELERLGSPALLYDSGDEAAAQIEAVIRNPGPPEKRRRWTTNAGWAERLLPVLRTLGLPDTTVSS